MNFAQIARLTVVLVLLGDAVLAGLLADGGLAGLRVGLRSVGLGSLSSTPVVLERPTDIGP